MKSMILTAAFIALFAGLTLVASIGQAISEQPAAGNGIASEQEPNETFALRVTYHLERVDGRSLAETIRELLSTSGHGIDVQSTVDTVTVIADAKLQKNVIDFVSAFDSPAKALNLPR